MILLCFESFMSFECHSVATLWCHWGLMGFPIHTSERIIRTEIIFSFWICISSVHHLPLPPSMAGAFVYLPLILPVSYAWFPCFILPFRWCNPPSCSYCWSFLWPTAFKLLLLLKFSLDNSIKSVCVIVELPPGLCFSLTEYVLFDWWRKQSLKCQVIKGGT